MGILSFKNLTREINGYGFSYSLKKYLITIFITFGSIVALGFVFKLWPVFIVMIAVMALLCVPFIIRAQFRFLYKQKQFSDIDVYLHQMIASFQKSSKIITALEDTYSIADGELKIVVGKALEILNAGVSATVYEDAFFVIEKAYPCERICSLHKFLLSVEKNGGNFKTSLNVLLSDIDRYVKRVYKHQEDIKLFKRDMGIGLVLAVCMGTATVLISSVFGGNSSLKISMDIKGNIVYQIASFIFFACCICYFLYVQLHYKCEWVTYNRTDKQILKDYRIVFGNENSRIRMLSIPFIVTFIVAAVILFLSKDLVCNIVAAALLLTKAQVKQQVYLGCNIIAAVLVVFAVWCVFIPGLDKKGARKRITEDLYNAFSEWLRDVSINLQAEPLQVAIRDTYDTCPVIMKPSLEIFIQQITEDPTDVEPYYLFLKEFNIMDIQATVRMLYSFTEIKGSEVDETINTLIERNYSILDKHDELNEKTKASMRGFAYYIPMLFAVGKLSVDMLLMISTFLG